MKKEMFDSMYMFQSLLLLVSYFYVLTLVFQMLFKLIIKFQSLLLLVSYFYQMIFSKDNKEVTVEVSILIITG